MRQLKNRSQVLVDMDDRTYPDTAVVNNRWEQIKKAHLKTGEAYLEMKEKKRKEKKRKERGEENG